MDFTRKELVSGNFMQSSLYPDEVESRLKFGLLGPHSAVVCIDCDPFARVIVSGHADNTIRIWHALSKDNPKINGKKLSKQNFEQSFMQSFSHQQEGKGNYYYQEAPFSPSKFSNQKLLHNFILIQTLHGHTGAITCIHVDAFKIVSGSRDHTIRVWSFDQDHSNQSTLNGKDQETKKKTLENSCLTLQGHNTAITSLKVDEDRIISIDQDGILKIWSFGLETKRKRLCS